MQFVSKVRGALVVLALAVPFTTTIPVLNASPVRVLYIAGSGDASVTRCHALMQQLGRDAIWFEFAENAESVTPEWRARFDAVIADGAVQNAGAGATVPLDFPAKYEALTGAAFTADARARILGSLKADRRAAYEKFLANREVEVREANPNVANYENRPEPISYQKPLSVKGSMERTQVPPDFRLELFATEPEIAKPIALAWDARGRCWVAETRDYPHGVQPGGEGMDSIKICEDTNGDGRADKFTVFADKLNIPTSLVFMNGGVLVAQPPRLLFLKDTNGDDKADVREVWMEGWGVRDTHAQASNFHWGLDNWIHGAVGYSGFSGRVGGKALQFGNGTFRMKRDGSTLEFLHQFSNNTWGQSQNAAGDHFGGTANGAPVFYGGIPETAAIPGRRLMSATKINLEDRAHAITPNYRQVDVFNGYTAAAGTNFVYSDALPGRLQGTVLVCEPTMKLVSVIQPVASGAGYRGLDRWNLLASSDEWLSPVFADVGPDGAVWVADWQNFIIQHNPTPFVGRGGYDAQTGVGGAHVNPLRDHERGRIYRVVWEGAKKEAARIDLESAGSAARVAALGHANKFWRDTAQRLLVESRATDAVPTLRETVKAGTSPAAVHALWTLHGLEQLDAETLQGALRSKSPELRRNAIRALPMTVEAIPQIFASGVMTDPDPVTRLAALVYLAQVPKTAELERYASQVRKDRALKGDEWLEEAAMLLFRKHGVSAFVEGENLLPNATFEAVGENQLPLHWTRRDYGGRAANKEAKWSVTTNPKEAREGSRAVRVDAKDEADTSLYADVVIKPDTLYRLTGWVKFAKGRGTVSLNDHLGRHQTSKVTRSGDWQLVETEFRSGKTTKASINLLFVASGTALFDEVKLVELRERDEEQAVAPGDVARGETIFYKHATVACTLCHMLKGQGSAVGPALDGLAAKFDAAYIHESLMNPNAKLAKGYENLGVSPMPPAGLLLKPQELADLEAFLATLK